MRAVDLMLVLQGIDPDQRITVKVSKNEAHVPKDGTQVFIKAQRDTHGTLELWFSGSSPSV